MSQAQISYCFYSYVHVFNVQPLLMCGEDVVSGGPMEPSCFTLIV